MKPLALVAADASTLPRIILDACAAGGRTVAGLVHLAEAAAELRTDLPRLGDGALLEDPGFLAAHDIIVGVGGDPRRVLSEAVIARGGTVATVIHPTAVISASASIGAGAVISAGVIVQMDATVGRYCSLNTACTVDHDNVLEDSVNIAPGAHLAGHVTVREGAFVGIGATIKGGVTIGRGATIGAGAVVLKDVAEGATVVGNPARPMPARP
jgi:sugar O-acyltransferase (sialic acid O-acetyltransferase NeuD family)